MSNKIQESFCDLATQFFIRKSYSHAHPLKLSQMRGELVLIDTVQQVTANGWRISVIFALTIRIRIHTNGIPFLE